MLSVSGGRFPCLHIRHRTSCGRARDGGPVGSGEGYYLNGTYYGDKDILALGVAASSWQEERYDVDS